MPRRFGSRLAFALLALLPTAALAQSPGINRAYMDTTCAPCRDFFRYANGRWYDAAVIPEAYTIIGAGREIADRNQDALRQVLERTQARAASEKDPTLKKLGTLYAVLMDSARADREGGAPLAERLRAIDGLQTSADLQREFTRTASRGFFGVPFRFGGDADPKNSSMTIGQLYQGGLGLPERDFYFRRDPKSDSLRREYVAHMGRMFRLIGDTPEAATANADKVMALETALAESSLTRVQMRDPNSLYHKMTVRELGLLTPALDWPAYFKAIDVPSLANPEAQVNVAMPAFMRHLNELIERTPMETWRAYLKWHQARFAAPWLGAAFSDEAFAFQSRLTGSRTQLPRWKRAAEAVDRAMGEALGKAYVDENFPPSSKVRMLEMVNNLQATYRERIQQNAWMSSATKSQAVAKLDAIMKKIGYPDTWRDYTTLVIDPKLPASANLDRAVQFETRRRLALIGKPVDRGQWAMTPPTVNAYYNPSQNEIVFPAGILQPPQFDPRVDDAVNYGAIGMVIGHELTHGFDDQGRQFDAQGNLRDWWTTEDATRFKQQADRVVQQYNDYVAVDSLHVNGRLTLGENLADLGGLTMAYYAWKRSLIGKPAPQPIDGFTPEQRFFLGFGQAWRRKNRPEALRTMALTDPHSPARWRVDGPTSNMKEFARAFGCKAGDDMVRDESVRAEIW